ncbi:MAG: PIG-L family deacetylase [Acidobacteriota bacterium]|nr:PIG-L family deacetylase [Acidobacteriota bacterium]
MLRRIKVKSFLPPRILILAILAIGALAIGPSPNPAQDVQSLKQAHDRYKADILLVVAHPDDEGAATPYLARAIDEGKRVAVVYGTRGSSGANEAGAEQAAALGTIREIEARRALATLGIVNVWFLDGKDTASQNVLQSLSNWNHGAALQQLVRLVRLTRPEVVLTFLPGTFIGEDHGDHQAAGVLATEAFDLGGDPASYPEQLAGPTKRLEPLLDNLRPWQPKKIYYFPDADKEDIFRGLGPEYSVKDIAKSSKRPYWRMALDAFFVHETQAKSFSDSMKGMSDSQIEKMVAADGYWGDALKFVRGKSLVGGSPAGDIFENISAEPISFNRYAGADAENAELHAEAHSSNDGHELSVELAGPWSFYAEFRRAHGLNHLPHPEPPEIALQVGTTLVIPLWLRNRTAADRQITLSADLPTGWTMLSGAGKFSIPAKQTVAARMEINLPATIDAAGKKDNLQEITVHAESDGKYIGRATLRVELKKRALPQ